MVRTPHPWRITLFLKKYWYGPLEEQLGPITSRGRFVRIPVKYVDDLKNTCQDPSPDDIHLYIRLSLLVVLFSRIFKTQHGMKVRGGFRFAIS